MLSNDLSRFWLAGVAIFLVVRLRSDNQACVISVHAIELEVA